VATAELALEILDNEIHSAFRWIGLDKQPIGMEGWEHLILGELQWLVRNEFSQKFQLMWDAVYLHKTAFARK
jgi:hypothetical protein